MTGAIPLSRPDGRRFGHAALVFLMWNFMVHGILEPTSEIHMKQPHLIGFIGCVLTSFYK